MLIKKKSILKNSRKEVKKTIFVMFFYVYIVGPIVTFVTEEQITSSIVAVLLGLPIYIFGMIIAKKREFVSIFPIILGITFTLFCSIIGNIDNIIRKFSDITIATILSLILPALIMIIDLVILFLYCVETNNEKILKIQKYLFIPFILLNITSIAMLMLTLLH